MTADTLRRSPLEAWADRLAALAPAISATEQPYLPHYTLRLTDAVTAAAVSAALGVDLPSDACTFTTGTGPHGKLDIAWMGPDEYLIVSRFGAAPGLEDAVWQAIGEARGAIVDVSAQRTTVALSGPHARDVLAHGCAIDLHPTVSPSGTCVQTLLARTGIVLFVQDAERGEFTLLVRTSFAPYFAAWLADACTEYRT